MNASNWIELAALIATILGGGGVSVSRLTRIAVGLEQLGRGLETLGGAVATTQATVQAHTAQLAVHESRLNAVQPPPS